MDNKILRIIVTVVAVILSFSAGSYLVRAITVERQVSSLNDKATAPLITEQEARDSVMQGCMAVDLSGYSFDQKTYCQCMIDNLIEDKGVNETIRLGLNVNDPAVEAELGNYASTCLARQDIF